MDSMITNVIFHDEDFFINTRHAHAYQNVPNGDTFPYVGLCFVLDETETTIYRETKTILEALSNTGGIMGFIFVSFGFTVMFFQEFHFRQAVLAQIFQYEEKEKK
mmetsp:Transcript_5982/g.5392  ORF Transcript_5982/g.5392 Transcript_5982/m.5392 type:complete len:105 (-) Transcript_5982:507-821(-)